MSGHWRFCVTAFLTLTGLSTLPASSNPLTDLFDFAPKEAATPAPPQEECLLQPGKSTAPRQHWLYRRQGHQKCWFQADEETVSVKKHIHHRVIKERSIAQEENEAALRNKTVLDARAQLLNASAGAPQSAVSAPGVVDTVPVATREAAVPAAPTATGPRLDAFTPENDPPRSVDVEGLLAASTLDKDMTLSSAPPRALSTPSFTDADDWQVMLARMGTVLIALGFVLLVGSVLARQLFDPTDRRA